MLIRTQAYVSMHTLSWIVNNLHPRTIDVTTDALLYGMDVKAVQDAGTMDGSLMNLPDYQSFYLPANYRNNTRGLLTYVR